MQCSNAALPPEAEVPMVSCNRGWVLLRKLVPICCRDTAPLLGPIPVRPFYEQGAKLLVRRFRRERGDDFLEARVAAQRVPLRIETELAIR